MPGWPDVRLAKSWGLLALAAGGQVEDVLGLLLQAGCFVIAERLGLVAGDDLLEHEVAVLVPAGTLGRTGLGTLVGLLLLHHDPRLAVLVGVVGAGEALVAVVGAAADELHLAALAEHLPGARDVLLQ